MAAANPLHRDLVELNGTHYLVRRLKPTNEILYAVARAKPFAGIRKIKHPYESVLAHPDAWSCVKDQDYLLSKDKRIIARLYADEQLPSTAELKKADTVFKPKKK